jgi:hypothetical protein
VARRRVARLFDNSASQEWVALIDARVDDRDHLATAAKAHGLRGIGSDERHAFGQRVPKLLVCVDLRDYPGKLAEKYQGIGAQLQSEKGDSPVVMDHPMPCAGETGEDTRPDVSDVFAL